MLLITADVEKIAELASLWLGSEYFSSNCCDASSKLETILPPSFLSKKCPVTGSLVPRYESLVPRHVVVLEAWFRDMKAWSRKNESLMQLDFTAYKRIVLVIRGAYP